MLTTELLERGRQIARRALPSRQYQALGELLNGAVAVRKIGWRDYLRLRSIGRQASSAGAVSEFSFANLLHPFHVRHGTPDATEVIHTVVRECYGRYLPAPPVRFIIDAGAYIGDSTAWYLSKFLSARVVALEPVDENFAMLGRNCSAFGSRVIIHRAALWPGSAQLRVCRDGRNGTDFSVVPAEDPSRADCAGMSPLTVLESEGVERIDILKCDVEGAEVQLFAGSDCDPWLDRTRSMYVDIHSQLAANVVRAAARRHGFVCRQWRELLVCSRDSC